MTDLADITVAYEEREKDLRAATSKHDVVVAQQMYLQREEVSLLADIESLESSHRRRLEPLQERLAAVRLQRERLDG